MPFCNLFALIQNPFNLLFHLLIAQRFPLKSGRQIFKPLKRQPFSLPYRDQISLPSESLSSQLPEFFQFFER